MADRIPPGFTSLEMVSGRKYQNLDLIGVVVDLMPPKPTRGTDWVVTFSIADLTSRNEGIRVRFFALKANLPKIEGTGDVVLLRNVQCKPFQGSDVVLSNFNTQWTVFRSDDIPEGPINSATRLSFVSSKGRCALQKAPTLQDMRYAVDICNMQDRSRFQKVEPIPFKAANIGSGTGSKPRDKFSLLKDVGAGTFYDLVGHVVKAYPTGDRLDLHITDYTSNALFYDHVSNVEADHAGVSRDGDEYAYINPPKPRQWNGPSGQRTMIVTMFPPHSSYAMRKVEEGDYVWLRNVHVKVGKDGIARLEGIMHEDRKFPDKVEVSVVSSKDDDRVKDILRRKRDYENQLTKDDKSKESKDDKKGNAEKCEKLLSRSQKKRKREKERKEKESTESAAKVQKSNPQERNTTSDILPKRPTKSTDTQATIRAAYLEENEYIVCSHPEKIIVPVSTILDRTKSHSYTKDGRHYILPFQNFNYRVKVRVVDFKPQRIEDFCVKTRVSEYADLSDNDDGMDSSEDDVSVASSGPPYPDSSQDGAGNVSDRGSEHGRKTHEWQWRFALLLEDASDMAPKTQKDRIGVYVSGKDAEFLLRTDPINLRRSEKSLAKLRETLFILWGNLEERKIKKPPMTETDNNIQCGRSIPKQEEHSKIVKATIGGGSGPDGRLTKPFTCCLKEYGIKRQGKWERKFAMFGATIQ